MPDTQQSVTAKTSRAIDRLLLEESTHTYFLDGEIIAGVTTVLKSAGIIDYSFIPQEVLLAASERGKAVHRHCERLSLGMLDWDRVDPDHIGYVNAYERFLEDSGFVPARVESRVYHETYRYAGTLDLTGMLNDGLAILDFKTGLVLPGHQLQVAAYTNCLHQPRRYRRLVLKLNGDSTYRLHEFPLAEFQRDVNIFLSALACYQFKLQKGIK